ncbi:hypothetical protein I3843_07G184500 [Carya illinoinensis]|nr:hypothetical protein I3843_07G184500 [Carya illinoinensis]KAG7972453.1 hypothetical protein I3843_07G184500 [Carya illinoinensis]
MASNKLSAPTLPKSGAISKGYNFASNWEQNAPLTDQQQAAILTLSHAVAERPFPPNHALDHVSHPDKALFVSVSVSDEDTPIQDSGPVIQPFLVNTNQHLWGLLADSCSVASRAESWHCVVNINPRSLRICTMLLIL